MTFQSLIHDKLTMSVEHYENFPVASLLLPVKLRQAVKNIYAFARTADDIADEGDAAPDERIQALEQYQQELIAIESGNEPNLAIFKALATTIKRHQLPLKPFGDLLSAFKQDVIITRYDTFTDLIDYCRRSANPVGCLMLHLYEKATPENLRNADAICSALQLINFWQDIGIDWDKNRVYLPQEDLIKFNINQHTAIDMAASTNWQKMMQFQTQRARELMISGSSLHKNLPWRFAWELRLVIQGGLRIAEKIDHVRGDVFKQRPKLQKFDWIILAWRAIFMN